MPRPDFMIQDDIARAIIRTVPGGFDRIVLNYEMDYTDADDEPVTEYIFFVVVHSEDGEYKLDDDLNLPSDVRKFFLEMNDNMLATGGSRWGSCDLTIESDGKYAFVFDYGPPKRLNGINDETSYDRFKNYLVTYKAEQQ